MTLEHVLARLDEIDTGAQKLLRDTGYTWYSGFGDGVCPDASDAQANFLRRKTEDIAALLEQLHEELCYLKTPTHGEQVLMRLANGRYGYLEADGSGNALCCGHRLEARLTDRNGMPQWVCTRIEHDGDDYYLVGHRHIKLDGLTVRERW